MEKLTESLGLLVRGRPSASLGVENIHLAYGAANIGLSPALWDGGYEISGGKPQRRAWKSETHRRRRADAEVSLVLTGSECLRFDVFAVSLQG